MTQSLSSENHPHNHEGFGDKGHDVFMTSFPTWINDLAQHHIGHNADHGHDGCAFGELNMGPISHCHAPSLQVTPPEEGMEIFANNVHGNGSQECGAAIYSPQDLMLHVQQHYHQQQPLFQQQNQYIGQFPDYMDLSQPFLMGNLTDFPQANDASASDGVQGRPQPASTYSQGAYMGCLPPESSPDHHF